MGKGGQEKRKTPVKRGAVDRNNNTWNYKKRDSSIGGGGGAEPVPIGKGKNSGNERNETWAADFGGGGNKRGTGRERGTLQRNKGEI